MLVINKPDHSMNNNVLSSKRILLIATMLSAMMLVASSMQSLVLTTAFAQEDMSDVNAEQAAATDEEGEEAAATDEDVSDVNALLTQLNEDTQLNVDFEAQEDINNDEGDDNSVTVDPIVQTSVQPDLNVNVDTHVITDEDDCEDASDDVDQANVQGADQVARSDGEVGEGSVHVTPILQDSRQVALNVNVDTDAILVEGCNPSDEANQANVQGADQEATRDLELGQDSTIIIPTDQNAGVFGLNIALDHDVIEPVF
ncbi:MAG TPA: hypothetical protein VHJ59_07690 [Nitrososphaera sp.]|nr:hypothetical protein [Nitrososphaera sp.]